jgi:hypothetical protein
MFSAASAVAEATAAHAITAALRKMLIDDFEDRYGFM